MSAEKLDEPLRRRRWAIRFKETNGRKPRVFVNSMSDLFHERLSDDEIAAVFGVMAACPWLTFLVLTKRAKRMREWFGRDDGRRPLPNVWLGVSVEDQQRADERIPELLRTPAAVRFISYEPALGEIELRPSWVLGYDYDGRGGSVRRTSRLDWLIAGGESGPGARPFYVAWARSAIKQCRDAGVACFIKQLGSVVATTISYGEGQVPVPTSLRLRGSKGGDMNEWPEDLRVRQFPREVA